MLETRLNHSLFSPPKVASSSALLVRIHPQEGIGEPVELSDQCLLVGRDQCGLNLLDDSVSRRHAALEYNEGGHAVTDLGSTNGTYVNECRITERKLQPGDRIRFGNQIFKYLTSQDIESQYHEVVYRIMTTDGLTQVYNKQYFVEALARELEHCQRAGDPLSVMLMDLDFFKSVNDTFGHLAGDAVLVEFARRARSVLRGGEIFARYGGEEFALLCPRSTLIQAAAAAERIRAAVAETPVQFEAHSIQTTVSIGIAALLHQSEQNALDLLADADHWLYVAKDSGRNRACYELSLSTSLL
jgi:diguanylate cyclase (GGDEF)-like protein